MRGLALFLLLSNMAFFAWSRYLSPMDAVADPAPLGRQIRPNELRIVGPAEAPSAAAKPPAATATQVSASAAAKPAAGGAPGSCVEWGSFTLADAPRAEKALEPLSLGPRLEQRRTEELAGWWVYIPPQGPAAERRQYALKKAAELKGLKVEDYFVVADDGPHRWHVSLGVFRSEEAAQARLATLRDQGVRSALVGARETSVPKVWFQVKGIDAGMEPRLKEIVRQVEGSELRPCL